MHCYFLCSPEISRRSGRIRGRTQHSNRFQSWENTEDTSTSCRSGPVPIAFPPSSHFPTLSRCFLYTPSGSNGPQRLAGPKSFSIPLSAWDRSMGHWHWAVGICDRDTVMARASLIQLCFLRKFIPSGHANSLALWS